MSGIASVYAVFANAEEAARIGRAMVEEGRAACVNILGPVRSFYRWKGTVEEAEEVAAIFKCRAEAAGALLQRIAALHSYEAPAAVVWPIADTLPAYAAWVEENGGG